MAGLDNDWNDYPTITLPNFGGKGTLVFYENAWLDNLFFPTKKALMDLQEFQFEDDIVVASFPKSGTTWIQEIVSQIESLHMENGAEWKSINVEDRFPFLESFYPGLNKIIKMKSPRYIKTHLPYQLLPPSVGDKAKVIYVARDPRDVSVSFYHFNRWLKYYNYTGPFHEYFHYFVSGQVAWGPWDKHVLSYWQKRDDKNLLFLTYESMHQEPHRIIREISNFIGKPITNDQLNNIVEETLFDKMQINSSINYKWLEKKGLTNEIGTSFLRKGVVGDWKNYFNDSMLQEIEELFNANPDLRKVFEEIKPNSKSQTS